MSGCTTPITKGYELAKENKFDATYAYLGVKDPELVKATYAALQIRGWDFTNDGNTLNIKVENGKVYVDSKGSTLDYQPIVPVLYMEMLKETIKHAING